MQHSVVSRRFIDSLAARGPFFQSPTPDFYATNVAFLKARRLLVYQRPLVTIGVTPRSYGFFHFNKDEKGGMEFLKNAPDAESAARLAHVILPGNRNNTSWLLAMVALETNFGREAGVTRLPAIPTPADHPCVQELLPGSAALSRRIQRGGASDATHRARAYGAPMRALFSVLRLVPTRLQSWIAMRLRFAIGQYSGLSAMQQQKSFRSILDVFEAIDPLADDVGERVA